MAQDALNRFWWPSIMMFGPHDSDSQNTDQSMAWKIKRFTNDELRQKFIDATVPQAEFLGLTIPDPDMAWDECPERGQGRLAPRPDRLGRVLARGEGRRTFEPSTASPPARRPGTTGAWVREAANAHAEKRAARAVAAE
jgi:ring-1,2-phenylacetyl-CoA epoxidase subunit PaaA